MTPEESVEQDIKTFETWLAEQVSTGENVQHYALAESIGLSAIPEYQAAFYQYIAEGASPKMAGEGALMNIVSAAFQLGYDFANSGHKLSYCKCDLKTPLVSKKADSNSKSDGDGTPGMYL